MDIIVLAICGVIANCDDWHDIELFAKKREPWFRRFLPLPNGIPAHDTFERLFSHLDPVAFMRSCVEWSQYAAGLIGVEHIAIDGKTLRGSASSTLGPLHVVSAWATQTHLMLGEVAVDGKSNEITAIPKLLELLDLHGALVTIDAIGCQKEIAGQIVSGGGDYVLAVKGNQPRLLQDIQEAVGAALDGTYASHQSATITTVEKGHGRVERRTYTIVTNLSAIRDRKEWPGLRTVGMCVRERTMDGKTTSEVHYFMGSSRMGARRYAEALRHHWRVENNLHWQLDVSFREDDSRIQDRHAAENYGLLRKLALGLLKHHAAKMSIARKRKAAAIDTEFLGETLMGAAKTEKI
jgi:predicted transposase YbfD/YdcC